MAVSVALYAANHLLFKRFAPAPLDRFFLFWFNDILAGLFICAFLNWWLGVWRFKPISSPLVLGLFTLFCGVVWELGSPLWKSGAVCDPWDFLAYLAGCGIYIVVSTYWKKHRHASS